MYKCTRCGDCRDKFTDLEPYICPAREHTGGFEPYYARGRIQVARGILEGRLRYSERLGETLFSCFCCGNCEKTCGGGIESVDITRAMRSDLIDAGVKPPIGIEQIASNIARTHNLFGSTEERTWEEIGVPSGGERLLYFPGCIAQHWLQEIVFSTTQIMRSAGTHFVMPGREEWCCGNPLLLTGHLDLAKEAIRHNLALIRDTGVSQIVTSCPGCYRTLKQDYPALGRMDLQVLHVSELMRDLVRSDAMEFTASIPERVTYHDPCELGRRSGIFEAPREIMSMIKGLELVEMPRNRKEALCCGGGGGVKASNPRLARRVALERLDEAGRLGVSKIVTCCPSCKMNLEEAIVDASLSLKVLDLTELIAQAMGITEERGKNRKP